MMENPVNKPLQAYEVVEATLVTTRTRWRPHWPRIAVIVALIGFWTLVGIGLWRLTHPS
jgi:hypothetical protein